MHVGGSCWILTPLRTHVRVISSQLHLKPDLPADNILVRNPTGDTVRSMYMTNDLVRQIVEYNDYTRMRLMTCGTKVMGKQEGAAAKLEGATPQYRVLSEGLPVMLPYIEPESVLSADLAALKVLMENYYPVVTHFQEPFRSAMEPKGTSRHTFPDARSLSCLQHKVVTL